MMRVRLKADGRIVEILPDGSEKMVDHGDPAQFVRHVRARCGLTQFPGRRLALFSLP